MLKNYLKIAIRSLVKNRLFSLLNVFGLAISLCVVLLLTLLIIQERSFDQIKDKEKVFRFIADLNFNGEKMVFGATPNAVGPTMKERFPEIKYAARSLLNGFGENADIQVENNSYIENRLYWTDPEILRIFDIRLIEGDPAQVLKAPNAVLLSQSKAHQYFGDGEAVGKSIQFNRSQSLEVTGVYEDLPATSTFDADLIASYSSTHFHRQGNTWDNASFETWILLDRSESAEKIAGQLQKVLDQHIPRENQYFSLKLQPLSDIHLYSQGIESYSGRKGDSRQLEQLGFLALALLVMAAINYMNLATARAQQRAKEVGVSKTLGANRAGLIGRFYLETTMLCALALISGILLCLLSIPFFNLMTGKELQYATLLNPVFLIGIPLLWLGVSLLSGIYPAVILSSFNPLKALHSGRDQKIGSIILRKSLVIVQFCASIVLIIMVTVMYRQMQYVSQLKLGYNPEQVIAISLNSLKSNEETQFLQNNIKALPGVEGISLAQAIPGKGEAGQTLQKSETDNGIWLSTNRFEGDVREMLQVNVLAGTSKLEKKKEGDSIHQVIINKYAADYLGLTPEEAIGKKIDYGIANCFISGVVDNFHYRSVHNPIGAYLFTNAPESIRYLLVRFNGTELQKRIAQFEQSFKKSVPDAAFDYELLDSQVAQLYRSDRQNASIMLSLSVFAILISCLGLFGLAAFSAEKRIKEVGIRKVLGASVASIVALLSTDFIRLVGISFLLACPIAIWMVNSWLNNFSYHIEPVWWMYAIAGVAAIVIALLTVSYQAIKAGMNNPVESLRDE